MKNNHTFKQNFTNFSIPFKMLGKIQFCFIFTECLFLNTNLTVVIALLL